VSILVRRSTTADPAFRALTAELDAELRARYGTVQDAYEGFNALPADTRAVLALGDPGPAGCGSFKLVDATTIEIKRVFVRPTARRRGVAGLVVGELETWARELGASVALLETGYLQHEAIALYERLGYTRTDLFPPYVGMTASVCMRKPL